MIRRGGILMGLVIFGMVEPLFSAQKEVWKEGDIIFQASRSSQSAAIQLATHSRYCHMGILLKEGSRWKVLEAIGHVMTTPAREWISIGEGKHYVVKRLPGLTTEMLQKMRRVSKRYAKKSYDPYFEWSDDRMYCSELVWKIFKEATGHEIGRLQPLKEFDLSNPIVTQKLHERFGPTLPLEQPMISPGAMFDSSELIVVEER